MIEKVNPSHPDKIADRIAGAIVDLAYTYTENPKVAVEVLIGHGQCNIIIESDVLADLQRADEVSGEIYVIVDRIAGKEMEVNICTRPQDAHLAENQGQQTRCGDNGIFLGMPLKDEERVLSMMARKIYDKYPCDGKYILAGEDLIVCQSNTDKYELEKMLCYEKDSKEYCIWQRPTRVRVNPLGDWTGGTDVDTGATNRKLGSDMGHSVTGGGLHGKDLSKADVSANIFCFEMAQATDLPVQAYCAIGDDELSCIIGERESKHIYKYPYKKIVDRARQYIKEIGGFEKFAEWGLF